MSFLKRIGEMVKSKNKSSPVAETDEVLKHGNASSRELELRQTTNSDDKQDSKTVITRERLDRMKTLTPREWEVYEHLIRGLKMREIAELLGVTCSTINFHCKGLYKKLGVNTRAQLFTQYTVLDADDVKKARKVKHDSYDGGVILCQRRSPKSTVKTARESCCGFRFTATFAEKNTPLPQPKCLVNMDYSQNGKNRKHTIRCLKKRRRKPKDISVAAPCATGGCATSVSGFCRAATSVKNAQKKYEKQIITLANNRQILKVRTSRL